MKTLLMALACGLALAGCGATQTLSPQDRTRVSAISIEKEVPKPKQMSYLGPGGAFGLMFGAIGGAVTGAASMPAAEAIREHAEKNNVLIENIVAQEMTAELRRSGKFQIVEGGAGVGADGGARMKFTVRAYGFSIPNGFSSKLLPTLSIGGELVDAKGATVWQAWDYMSLLGSPVEGVAVEDLKDPQVIERLWREAARTLAQKIVAGI